MIIRLTKNAQVIINDSKKYAVELGSSYIGTEHLLLAILATDCVGCKILNENNVFYVDVLELIMNHTNNSGKEISDDVFMSPKFKSVLVNASQVIHRLDSSFIGSEHLLYSICEQNESFATKILVSLGNNLQALMSKISDLPNKSI